MDIREFLDELYQLWAKTTGAENQYWMPANNGDPDDTDYWFIKSVGEEGEENAYVVADILNNRDVDFITAIHGALPDLVRRTHEALDEADRLDEQRDEQEVRIARLEEIVDERNRDIEYINGLRTAELNEMDKQIQKTLALSVERDRLLEEINSWEDQVAQLTWELSKERGE
ncbi:hypothetical protein [Mycobacteroides abscessus]|uniref:hypothetical protein n=1 Tax=Mycobacteroides abscessus TaxID=36809 RepID=UPI0018E4563C|nr:hypothetical protein [Mycobacteroides abscessus]